MCKQVVGCGRVVPTTSSFNRLGALYPLEALTNFKVPTIELTLQHLCLHPRIAYSHVFHSVPSLLSEKQGLGNVLGTRAY